MPGDAARDALDDCAPLIGAARRRRTYCVRSLIGGIDDMRARAYLVTYTTAVEESEAYYARSEQEAEDRCAAGHGDEPGFRVVSIVETEADYAEEY